MKKAPTPPPATIVLDVPLKARISYHETDFRNPATGRWRRGPVVKRITLFAVVEGETIALTNPYDKEYRV